MAMIAAGSLFTSCIEQVEPLGIQDLRYAKAEYIRALKDLRAADAEYRRAEAAVQQAIARYEDALTAGVNADTEYQKLLNEYQALVNQDYAGEVAYNEAERLAKLDSLQKAMEVRELNHKRALAEAEKDMRIAQEDLRVTIRNISLAAGDLTANEKVAIYEAAAVYYYLLEQVIIQDSIVNAAQIDLATAEEYALRFCDKEWSSEQLALVDVYEYYQEKIEAEQAKIAFWQEKYENLPDTAAAIAQWKAYMDAFDDEIDAIEVKQAKNVANKTAYEALVKESIRDFDIAVAEWIEENWENEKDTLYIEPKNPGAAKTQANFKFNTKKDSLAIPALVADMTDPGFIVYQRFGDLLGEYDDLPANQYDVASKLPFKVKHNMAEVKVDGNTVTMNVYATTAMKNFIFGNTEGKVVKAPDYKDFDGNDVKGKEAAYGIDGAISVLERELVLVEKAGKTQEELDEILAEKDSIYKARRKILEQGFTKYEPYTTAKSNLEKLGDGGAKAFFEAVNALYATLEDIDGDVELNTNDSVAVLGAIAAYAAARDKYLDDVDSDGKVHKYAKGKNPKYFYFSSSEDAEGPVIDSVLFSELLTQASKEKKVKAVYYEYLTTSFAKRSLANRGDKGIHRALYNILDQLFPGKTLGSGIDAATNIDLKLTTNLNASTTTLFTPGYKLDSWKEATKLTAPASYEPKALKDAKQDVADAIADYVAIYEDYWGGESYPGGDPTVKANREKEIPVGTYVAETFTEPYQIVNFDGTEIVWTKGLGAIMNLIDPKVKGQTPQSLKDGSNHLVATAIFGTASDRTPFAEYLSAKQDAESHGSLTPRKEALDAIKAWAEKVRTVFDNAIAKDGTDDTASYESWKEGYEPAKKAWDAYKEVKDAFVGYYINAKGDTIPGSIKVIKKNTTGRDTVVKAKSAWLKANGLESLFAQNIVGQYVGWCEDLAGEQLEIAEELFGEEPWEQYNEWNEEAAQYTEQIKELKALKKKAEKVYMAKAQVEGLLDDNTSGSGKKTIAALYKAYVEAYEALQKELVVFDEFGNVDPDDNTAKINKAYKAIEYYAYKAATYESDAPKYEHEINYLQHELEKEQNRLKSFKDALKLAKENYDRIREYLLSQDGVSYVIPVSTADLDDAIMNIEYLLRSLGHTFADVYSEVGDKIGI